MQPPPSGPLADGQKRWGDIKWHAWDLAFRERPVRLERVQDGWCNRVSAMDHSLYRHCLSFRQFTAKVTPSPPASVLHWTSIISRLSCSSCLCLCESGSHCWRQRVFDLSFRSISRNISGTARGNFFLQVCGNRYLDLKKKELGGFWWWRWLWPHICLQLSHKISRQLKHWFDFWQSEVAVTDPLWHFLVLRIHILIMTEM